MPANVVVLVDNIGPGPSMHTMLDRPPAGTVVGDTALVLDPNLPEIFVLGFDAELKLAEIGILGALPSWDWLDPSVLERDLDFARSHSPQ